MKQALILSIDGGTQSTKVSFYTSQGECVASARDALKPIEFSDNGQAVHPQDDLWRSLLSAVQAAYSLVDKRKYYLSVIGLCSIRCCRALLNQQLQLVSPVMSWMDTRLASPFVDDDSEVAFVTTASGYLGSRLTDLPVDTAANYEGQWPIDKQTWQ